MKPLQRLPYLTGIDLEFSFYSLDRILARDLIAGTSSVESPWNSVQELLAKNRAKFEHIISLQTRSGQRASANENGEVRFGKEYSPAGSRAKIPEAEVADPAKMKDRDLKPPRPPRYSGTVSKNGAFTTFEAKETGITVEVEPTIEPVEGEGTFEADPAWLDLNVVIHNVQFRGQLRATGVATHYPAQSVFEKRSISTSLVTLLGSHLLVGTLNPPGANGVNGRADEGRVWLVFVRYLGAKP